MAWINLFRVLASCIICAICLYFMTLVIEHYRDDDNSSTLDISQFVITIATVYWFVLYFIWHIGSNLHIPY